jgi:hypothetical protein
VPIWPTSRAALAGGLGDASWRRRWLSRAVSNPTLGRVLGALLPNVGLVLRRPGSNPATAWLFDRREEAPQDLHATIAVSWRGPEEGAVLTGWTRSSAEPAGVAKIDFGSPDRLRAEQAALDRAGEAARNAGAAVPHALALRRTGRAWALAESPLAGRPAAELLRADGSRVLPLLSGIASWLRRWNGATAASEPLGAELLERLLLHPAAIVEAELTRGAAYRRWIARLALRVRGRVIPVVDVHNDLTTANILWSAQDELGSSTGRAPAAGCR